MPAIYTDLKDKVVLLTGVGQVPQDHDRNMWGNGAATAHCLAQSGAKIFGCDLDLASAEHTKKRVEAAVQGSQVDVMKADVTKSTDVKALVQACLNRHGRIDVLICNVGKSAPGGPAEMDEKTWYSQIDVNLTSAYHCCHEVLPILERQGTGGSIVLLSSVAGIGYIGKSHIGYSTTKAALINFAKVVGARYASQRIRCNVVVPGLIHTPLVARLSQEYNAGDYEGLVKKRSEAVPMGRMGTGQEVANAVTFLCSEEAAGYITGTDLVVDGGLTAVVSQGG